MKNTYMTSNTNVTQVRADKKDGDKGVPNHHQPGKTTNPKPGTPAPVTPPSVQPGKTNPMIPGKKKAVMTSAMARRILRQYLNSTEGKNNAYKVNKKLYASPSMVTTWYVNNINPNSKLTPMSFATLLKENTDVVVENAYSTTRHRKINVYR